MCSTSDPTSSIMDHSSASVPWNAYCIWPTPFFDESDLSLERQFALIRAFYSTHYLLLPIWRHSDCSSSCPSNCLPVAWTRNSFMQVAKPSTTVSAISYHRQTKQSKPGPCQSVCSKWNSSVSTTKIESWYTHVCIQRICWPMANT